MIKFNALRLVFLMMIFQVFSMSYVFSQTFTWGNATPEAMGFSSEKLDALRDTLAEHRTTSVLVIRNDRIVLEWYSPGWDQNRKHYTASLAKALVGGMSLILLLDDWNECRCSGLEVHSGAERQLLVSGSS